MYHPDESKSEQRSCGIYNRYTIRSDCTLPVATRIVSCAGAARVMMRQRRSWPLVVLVAALVSPRVTLAFTAANRPTRLSSRTVTFLGAESTRRQSFGEILGSAILPVAAATTAAPGSANAADDYPFKVGQALRKLGALLAI
jgi:hypothetical protein